jgi:hypothetical protein
MCEGLRVDKRGEMGLREGHPTLTTIGLPLVNSTHVSVDKTPETGGTQTPSEGLTAQRGQVQSGGRWAMDRGGCTPTGAPNGAGYLRNHDLLGGRFCP